MTPASVPDNEFVTYVIELMQAIGPVRARRMFGGHGIFIDELMFGLVADGTLYLKADNETENDYRERGLDAFSYNKKGKVLRISYYQVPAEALEDSEEMNAWANKAYATALRVASKKRNHDSR